MWKFEKTRSSKIYIIENNTKNHGSVEQTLFKCSIKYIIETFDNQIKIQKCISCNERVSIIIKRIFRFRKVSSQFHHQRKVHGNKRYRKSFLLSLTFFLSKRDPRCQSGLKRDFS